MVQTVANPRNPSAATNSKIALQVVWQNRLDGHQRSGSMLKRIKQKILMASILFNSRKVATAFASRQFVASTFASRQLIRSSARRPNPLQRCFLTSSTVNDGDDYYIFTPGTPVTIEITNFGPIGASVDIIGSSHDEKSIVAEGEPALGKGLVLQKEIHYYRQARDDLDVVMGEVLNAYIEKRNEETGNYLICLREYGGKRKSQSIGAKIMARLDSGQGVPVGDKSSPDDIAKIFPGVSKGTFKKAVANLYKQRKVRPGPYSVRLYDDDDED